MLLFTLPGSMVGIVMALMAAGQGFSITAPNRAASAFVEITARDYRARATAGPHLAGYVVCGPTGNGVPMKRPFGAMKTA